MVSNIQIYRSLQRIKYPVPIIDTSTLEEPEVQIQPQVQLQEAPRQLFVRNLNIKPQSTYPSQSGMNNYRVVPIAPLPPKTVNLSVNDIPKSIQPQRKQKKEFALIDTISNPGNPRRSRFVYD